MPLRKSTEQIAMMRRAGRVVAEMLEVAAAAARPGASSADLDSAARGVLDRRGARSSFLGYHGFPAVVCVSPNEVVIHGIPGQRVLEEGDIVSIDGGAIVEGWHADAAVTVGVGEVDQASGRLIEATRDALAAATRRAVPDSRLGDLGEACEAVVEAAGLAVVRDYTGHGIGTAMHEEPQVPNFGRAGRGARLRAGMVLAIEPMVVAGGATVMELADGWTVVTRDRSRSAHFEHTVAITESGPEVLTAP
ncbi:MAG: type I methionyl aminopeptidase [Acidimicrobiia bacterium]|nr:type I methionyl aminopeptidase [Acidimicrobiia bacterium]